MSEQDVSLLSVDIEAAVQEAYLPMSLTERKKLKDKLLKMRSPQGYQPNPLIEALDNAIAHLTKEIGPEKRLRDNPLLVGIVSALIGAIGGVIAGKYL